MRNLASNRRCERGQAICELTVALLGICSVFVGLIFVLAVGQANLDSFLTARGTADANSLAGFGGAMGIPISRWEVGGDEMMFTNDDEPVMFFADDPALFKDELNQPSYDLTDTPDYVMNNAFETLADSWMFLSAANLAGDRTEVDPFEFFAVEDLRGVFRALIYRGDISVSNAVYMPACESMEE